MYDHGVEASLNRQVCDDQLLAVLVVELAVVVVVVHEYVMQLLPFQYWPWRQLEAPPVLVLVAVVPMLTVEVAW